MGKALVIKNADFSACAVTTITFDEEVPCTAVAFDSASVTLDSLGTADIGYTVTPSNTTDTVTLASSDSTVISVSGTTITAVGVGTATLTLTCGSYSATCTVTVEVVESPIMLIAAIDEQTINDALYGSINGSSKRLMCAGDYTDGFFSVEMPIYGNNYFDPGAVTAIKIPSNASTIHISADHVYGGGENLYFVNANESATGTGSAVCVPIISNVSLSSTTVGGVLYIDKDVTIPDGATGYILVIRPASSSAITAITTEDELVTYAADTHNLAITYA